MIDFVSVGQRIAAYRRELGLSQEELASTLYVTRQALSKWENGISIPSIDTLVSMSRLFGVSFEEILGLGRREAIEVDRDDIFRGHDRGYIIEKIISGEIQVSLPDVFYQMSPGERMHMLKFIKDGTLSVPKRELWVKLTPSEQKYLGGTEYEIRESDHRRSGVLPTARRRFRMQKREEKK